MGKILGLGMTHYPPLIGLDQNMAGILRTVLDDPGVPRRLRDPAGWPDAMRREQVPLERVLVRHLQEQGKRGRGRAHAR